MIENTDVTIVIPNYNSGGYLLDAIESALSQSKKSTVLVIDDFSTDNSYKYAREHFLARKDSGIKFLRNEANLGYQANWNRCLDTVTTQYALILHCDDKLKPNAIEILYNSLQKNNNAVISSSKEIYFSDEFGERRQREELPPVVFEKGDVFNFLRVTNSYLPCSGVMFNMSKLEHNRFCEDLIATDEYFWPKLLMSNDVILLDEFVVMRRIHNGQAEIADFQNKFQKIKHWSNYFPIYINDLTKDSNCVHLAEKKVFNNLLSISLAVSRSLRGRFLISLLYLIIAMRYLRVYNALRYLKTFLLVLKNHLR